MDTVRCIWTSALAEGRNITIESYKDLFLIREQSVELIFSDNTSINRFVISEAILQCLKLLYENWTKDSELYSVNTEGFFMTNPKHQYQNKCDDKFKTGHIGKPFMTNTRSTYFEKLCKENLDTSKYTDYVGDGCIYYGAAGCGKTTKLCKLASTAKDPVILSFTNKAIENVKSRIHVDLRDSCHTFDSYFCDYHGRDINSLDGKTIFIEEYSMVPNKWMTKIYRASGKAGNRNPEPEPEREPE